VSTFFKDLRYGVRALAAAPGFTTAAILCLALGIGMTTAIFSVVHAVLLRQLGYREPDRLVRIYTEFPQFANGGLRRFWTSPPEYDELKRETQSWETLDAWRTGGINLAGAADPIRVTACYMTGDLQRTLGVTPSMGRGITPADDEVGAAQVAVISQGLWERAFAGDRSVIGRTIQINGRNANVIGVMPASFSFPPGELDAPEIWLPFQLGPPNPQRRGNHFLYLLGRLKPGVTLKHAQEELDRHVDQSAARLGPNHPFSKAAHPLITSSLHEEVVRGIRPALWTLMGAVAFVLLIACVNVANLLLARAEARQREIAIRKALGAGVGQLIRQFTIEGLLLSMTGAAAGLGLAYAGLKVMVAAGKESIPRASEVTIDPTVLIVTLAVSLLTALLFGLAPLAQIAAGTLHDALKAAGGRTAGSVSSNRFRGALVASELALALILLIGTGLMIKAFWKLSEVHAGFRPEGLLTLRVNLQQATYPKNSDVTHFWELAQAKLAAIPGIDSATAMKGLPPARPIDANDTQIENFTPVPNGPGNNIDFWQIVGDRFFDTMGTRLLEGRYIDSRDTEASTPVVVVNQTMARTYYGGQSALGHRIRPGFQDPWRTIVGVVEDVKNSGLDASTGTEIFLPYKQGGFAGPTIYFAMHTSGNPASLISAARNAIRSVDPSLPLSQEKTMEEVMAGARSRPRFLTTLLGLFSGTALLLAAVGLYGVISYSVTRRTTEFGIRMAMGAERGDVMGLVLRQAMTLAMIGVTAGAIGALVLTRLIRGLLFGVSSFDPLTFVAMAAVLLAVTALACVVPARRATMVDPLVALRNE
jgi:putative ABC transport system permease protein